MSKFADHFSFASAAYASFRPSYPAALFEWLASIAPDVDRVWDCGTGSGQAASALSKHFTEVIATDASVSQLARARRAPGVHYAAMTAEQPALATRSMGLVTVAQAMHWFHLSSFHESVARVLRPGGVLAVWSYGLATIAPVADALISELYQGTLGPYWPPERALVDAGYAGIEFPFEELPTPEFTMEAAWSLLELGGYLSTWSAVGRYRAARGEDPLPAFLQRLEGWWGTPTIRRAIRWPLAIRAGTVR